ncbi:MAG: hypothetical protein WCP34_09550 [Pseudomonadota bacterium]
MGAIGFPDRRSGDQRGSQDRRTANDGLSLPLVTPGVCRRRDGLESLINLGGKPYADTDTDDKH